MRYLILIPVEAPGFDRLKLIDELHIGQRLLDSLQFGSQDALDRFD